jgi:hypothetical protein
LRISVKAVKNGVFSQFANSRCPEVGTPEGSLRSLLDRQKNTPPL